MKNYKSVFILLILFSLINLNTEEQVVVTVIELGHQYYGMVEKIEQVFDNNNPILTTFFFTKDYENENGRIYQSQEYRNGKIAVFTTEFNENYTGTWGISKIQEVMNSDGQLKSIIYTFYNQSTYEFSGDGLNSINSFEPRLINTLISSSNYGKSDDQLNPILNIDSRGIGGATLVTNIPDFYEPIDPQQQIFIQYWYRHRRLNDISELFNNKITVNENGVDIELLIQDELLDQLLEQNETVVYYYHLGALDDKPINIVVSFYEFE